MLQQPDAIGEAIQSLADAGESAFLSAKHQQLFRHIVELYDGARPIDGVVIKDELVRRGLFESLGGFEFLAGLISAVPSALRARDYAGIVREKYLLRELLRVLHESVELAYGGQRPAQEVLDDVERMICRVTERRITGGAQRLPDLIQEVFRTIDARGDGHALTGEPTGFHELDDLTCGLQPAELIIIAGRPSMGKTAFGLNLAENLAINERRPCLFFSLEMSRQQVAQRILCSWSRVDAHKLRRGQLRDADLEQLQRAADQITGSPLFIDDAAGLTVTDLRSRARMAHRRHKLRAVFVDYLQLMREPEAARQSRQNEVAAISAGLKGLAKELNIPVVAMAQLNRGPEDRSGNRPRMSDLRESGAIEQDADVIGLLHREAYFKPQDAIGQQPADNTAELIIAKQRNGPVGTIELHFNKQWTRFDNHAPAVGRYADPPQTARGNGEFV